MALSVLGVILGFLLLIVLTYKGLHLSFVSIIVALLLIVTSNLPFAETWDSAIAGGISQVAGMLIPLFLLGAAFGKILASCGAADSFAKGLLGLTTKNASPKGKRIIAAFIIIFLGIVMAYAGVDNFAILFTQIAIAASIMKEVNIPRHYMPTLIILGSTVGGLLPGTPSIINIFAVQYLKDTTAMAGAVPAAVGALTIYGASLYGLSRMWEKDIEKGINFEYGPLTKARFDEENLPPAFLILVPTIVIMICFNTFKLSPVFALMLGLAVAILCFFNYLPYEKEDSGNLIVAKTKSLVANLNDGAAIAGIPAIILINFALGNVISKTPAFEGLVAFVSSVSGSPIVLFTIISIIVVGVSASMSGLLVMFNLAATLFIPLLGLNAVAAHRIIAFSATVLDTMPFGTMVISLLLLTGIKHKEGYPPILLTTVGFTFLATVVVALLFMLFPGLA